MIFTILVCLLVFLSSVYLYRKWRYVTMSNTISGPSPEFLLGNMRNTGLLSGRKIFHEVFYEMKRIYGDVFTFWFGPYRWLVFNRVEHAQHILTSRHINEISDLIVASLSLMVPNSISVARHQTWKRHARVILPMLKRTKVVNYMETIVRCTDWLIDTHLTKIDGGRKDLRLKCQTLLLKIIESIAFGSDPMDNQKKTEHKQQEFFQALQDYTRATGQLMILTGISKWFSKLYLCLNWKYQNASRLIRQHCMSIVAEEQKLREHMLSPNSNRRNIFSFFVSSLNDNANDNDLSSGLTLSELLDEIKNFVHGGFDTTATVLAWLMHFTSKHPHVQQRIKDELREHDLIPISDNVALNSNVLNSLIYVDCVIKEVFRCAPIVAGLSRTALCDDLIDGTIHVKKGDTVLIPIFNIHSDSRYWHIDPSKFMPERFLHEDKDHHPFAFVPFGGGHRACAGQELAWLELRTIVVRMMQRVTFEDTGMKDNSGGYDQQMLCYPRHLAIHVRVDNE